MVRDRISELRAKRRNGSNFRGDLLQEVRVMMSTNTKINNVLEKAAEIRESIELIVNNVDIIKKLHNNVLSHTNPDIRRELEGRTMIIDITASRIHKQLNGDEKYSSQYARVNDNTKDIGVLCNWHNIVPNSARLVFVPMDVDGYININQYKMTISPPNVSDGGLHVHTALYKQLPPLGPGMLQIDILQTDYITDFIDDTTNIGNSSIRENVRDGPTHTRITILQYTTMKQMFSDIMLDYNESLLRYHEKCSSLLNQQKALIRKPNSSHPFVEEDIDEEKTNLFVDNILEDSRLAKQQLSDLQSRHEEVLKLEKSIVEIRDIFLEMAYNVEKQGDQLNCVEYFACQATDNIDSGRSNLKKTEKRSNRYKKRKWKIIIVVVLIFVLFLIIAIYL